KSLTVNFRRNRMHKALISILHPSLRGKDLNLRQEDDISLKVGKWLARDYKMNLLEQDEEPSSDYICNVHLMDYKAYGNADIALNEEDLNQFFEDNQLNDGRSEEHTSEFQSRLDIVFRLLLEIKKFISIRNFNI